LASEREIEAFLIREADLIDRHRLDEWLTLFITEAIYWVPATPEQKSGIEEISHIYDDRMLLETRVRRLQHALIHAQRPASRTVHLITNIRRAEDQPEGAVAVDSNQLVTEWRGERMRQFAGFCRHELVESAAGLRIRLKRFDLIDADAPHEGISIIL
jgi:benzoate/toluate 1,2-dioxygenase beta subunit